MLYTVKKAQKFLLHRMDQIFPCSISRYIFRSEITGATEHGPQVGSAYPTVSSEAVPPDVVTAVVSAAFRKPFPTQNSVRRFAATSAFHSSTIVA